MDKTFNIISGTKVEITTMVPQVAVYDIAEFQGQVDVLNAKITDLQAQRDAIQATIDSVTPKLEEYQKANPASIIKP